MSIGTILLIAGAVGIMFLMHRVGHGGHAAAHGAHGGGGAGDSPVLSPGGRSPTGGDTSRLSTDADDRGGHDTESEKGRDAEGQGRKQHGCC